MHLLGSTPREIRQAAPARAHIVGARSALSHAIVAWQELARWRMATQRTTRRPAGSGYFESPLSQSDWILASPLLSTTQERFETRSLAPPPDTSSTHRAGLPKSSMRLVVSRLQLTDTLLQLNLASLFGRGPVRFDNELRIVLMFALSGLAVSLFLAAKIQAIGDALVGISIGF